MPSYEIQVKLPVCVILDIDQTEADCMSREDLCRLLDKILEKIDTKGECCGTDFRIEPYWDYLPPDDIELVLSHYGLFPLEDDQ